MTNIHVDPGFDDDERRRRLYAGDIVVYTHVREIAAFAGFTRDLITERFAPHDPVRIHDAYSPDELADILIDFKPAFIHHPESITHVRKIVEALGADPSLIHADVPKLRSAFPIGGLSTGIAYAFQPHRDTWYGAPPQQINWWMPVFPVRSDNIMEFFPRGFGREVPNNSADYDYYVANAWRGRIKDFSGGKDMRVHPAPLEPLAADEPRTTIVPPVGGIMLFSGDNFHASLPNTSGLTRYSIDFRTVDVRDVRDGVGAPMVDVACTGTAIRDFRGLVDRAEFTDEEVAPYDHGHSSADEGVKVFAPVGRA